LWDHQIPDNAINVFSILIIFSVILHPLNTWPKDWMPFICALRAGLLVVLALYGFTTNTYIWHSTGVNSTLIFEFDSHDYRSFTQLYEVWNIILSLLATIFSYVEVIIIVWFSWTCLQIASLMGVIWIICVYLFVFADWLSIPPEIGPAVILLIFPAILFMPLPLFYWHSRLWLMKILVSD